MLPWREETLPDTTWKGWYYAIPTMDPRNNFDRGLGGYFTKYVGCSQSIFARDNEPPTRAGVTHPRGPGDYEVQYRSTNPYGIAYYIDPRPNGFKYPFMWQWRQPPCPTASFRMPPPRVPWSLDRPQATLNQLPRQVKPPEPAPPEPAPPEPAPPEPAPPEPAPKPTTAARGSTFDSGFEGAGSPKSTPVLERVQISHIDSPVKQRKVYYKSPWDEPDSEEFSNAPLDEQLVLPPILLTSKVEQLKELKQLQAKFAVPTSCTTHSLEPTAADREHPIDISGPDNIAAVSLDVHQSSTLTTVSSISTHTQIRKSGLKRTEHVERFYQSHTMVNARSSTRSATTVNAARTANVAVSGPASDETKISMAEPSAQTTCSNGGRGKIHDRRSDSSGGIWPVITNAGSRNLATAAGNISPTSTKRRNAKTDDCPKVVDPNSTVSTARAQHHSKKPAPSESLLLRTPERIQGVRKSSHLINIGNSDKTGRATAKINPVIAGQERRPRARPCQIENEDLLCQTTQAPSPPTYTPPKFPVMSTSLLVPTTPPMISASCSDTVNGIGRGTNERQRPQKWTQPSNRDGVLTPPSTPHSRRRTIQVRPLSGKKPVYGIESEADLSVARPQNWQAITPRTSDKRHNQCCGTTNSAEVSSSLVPRPKPPPWALHDIDRNPCTLDDRLREQRKPLDFQEFSFNSPHRDPFYAPPSDYALRTEGISEGKSITHATPLPSMDNVQSPQGHITILSELYDMHSGDNALAIANFHDTSETPITGSQVLVGIGSPKSRGHACPSSTSQESQLEAGNHAIPVTTSELLCLTTSIQHIKSPLSASKCPAVSPVSVSRTGNTAEENTLPQARLKDTVKSHAEETISVVDEAVAVDATVLELEYTIEDHNVQKGPGTLNMLPTCATARGPVTISSNTVKEGKTHGQKTSDFGVLEVITSDWVDLETHAEPPQQQLAELPAPYSTQLECIEDNKTQQSVADAVPKPDPVPARRIADSYALIKEDVNGTRPPPPSTAEEFQAQLETFIESHDLSQFFLPLPGSNLEHGRVSSASIVQPLDTIPSGVNSREDSHQGSTKVTKMEGISIQGLAQKAFEKSQEQDTETAQYYADLSKISLYTTILLVDDSASMREHDSGSPCADELGASKNASQVKKKKKTKTMRQDDCGLIKHVKQALERITRIATTLDSEGISIRFLNADVADLQQPDNPNALPLGEINLDGIKTEEDMKKIVDACPFRGGTELGTMLSKKVLEPLLRHKVELKPPTLQRPVLVSIITDGEPEIYHEIKRKGKPTGRWVGESRNKCQEVIADCKRRLIQAGYPEKAIAFHITQIGGNKDADEYLNALATDPYIGNMIYCSSERLDKQVELYNTGDMGRAYQLWGVWVQN
ncbi:hypothetical protein EV426DRAFT_575566 [Tirmania nivea]|nr:hypothetical protein EV426DRAFT_575566 [Tirmania nivea]